MSGRSQPRLANDEAGHEERIRRANQRTVEALQATLAQDADVLKMGRSLRLNPVARPAPGELTPFEIVLDLVDSERLGFLAIKLRPFHLEKEEIHYPKLVKSLRHFADTDGKRTMVDQIPGLWEMCGKDSMTTFVAKVGEGELIPGGVGNTTVADRVLYSQLAHADDASELLSLIPQEWQRWSLATLVGDWTAMAAHQQYVMRLVRPDLVSELTEWAGDGRSIFERFGSTVQEFTDD